MRKRGVNYLVLPLVLFETTFFFVSNKQATTCDKNEHKWTHIFTLDSTIERELKKKKHYLQERGMNYLLLPLVLLLIYIFLVRNKTSNYT